MDESNLVMVSNESETDSNLENGPHMKFNRPWRRVEVSTDCKFGTYISLLTGMHLDY
jgi:hypothetical protein